MKSWSAGDWFQFSSVIAVVIGVVIVVWELQESREIAAAQIATDAFQMLTQQEASMEGDSAAEALANVRPSRLIDNR